MGLKIRIVLAFAAIYLIWGSTYLAIRFALETLPPLFIAGARFFTFGLLAFSWMYWRGASMPHPNLWLSAAVVGIPLVTITYGLLFWAQQTVPSGLAALFFSIIPMWMVILDWVRPSGIRPRWSVIAGIGLGIAGVGLLVSPTGLQGNEGVTIGGAAMLLISTASWSLGSILSRHVPQPASKIQSTSMIMLSGGAILLIISLLAGELQGFEIGSTSPKSWLALTFLVGVASIGHLSYLWLLTVSSAAKVATYAFVNPVVALVLGVLFAGETLSQRTILSSIVIISGVMMIVLVKSRTENARGGNSSHRLTGSVFHEETKPHESATQ